MKFAIATAATLIALPFTNAIRVSWDSTYDNENGSFDSVICSDGDNGLETKYGWEVFGDAPTFPLIGGAQAIASWNSESCGTCWSLTYTPSSGSPISINVLAVDHTDDGFNLGKQALNQLTNGRAEELGAVDAEASQVDISACGL